jgi:hypothetical protein
VSQEWRESHLRIPLQTGYLTIEGRGNGRYHFGATANLGFAPFVTDTRIYATGTKRTGDDYKFSDSSAKKSKNRKGGYPLWTNHTTTPQLKRGQTLSIRGEQDWSVRIPGSAPNTFYEGDLYIYECKVR